MQNTANQPEGIIILGPPRSGTTLLRRLVDAHPNIACPGETNLFGACARFLHREALAEGVDVGVLGGLSFAGFHEQEVLARVRELAFGLLRDHARREGKDRWAEKTAFSAFYLDAIETLCAGHVHFVCIQRHGLDCVCSLQELCETNGVYLKEIHDYLVRYPRPLEAFARIWVDLTQAIRFFVDRHPGRATLIRYEDLAADPDRVMCELMRELDERWEPRWTAEALARRDRAGLGDWKTYGKSAVDTESIGRWRSLSPRVLEMLRPVVNPTLELCGYDPLRMDPWSTTEASRRRYELGLLVQGLGMSSPADRQVVM
jgi:hypothetical protein